MIDPTEGCPGCATLTSVHADDCDYLRDREAESVDEMWFGYDEPDDEFYDELLVE